MNEFWNDESIVEKTPVVTTALLESANAGQLWHMWTEWTADGQSLVAWIFVNMALLLWLNFYRVCTPDQKWAFWATAFGVAMNASVIFTVALFRYVI